MGGGELALVREAEGLGVRPVRSPPLCVTSVHPCLPWASVFPSWGGQLINSNL